MEHRIKDAIDTFKEAANETEKFSLNQNDVRIFRLACSEKLFAMI